MSERDERKKKLDKAPRPSQAEGEGAKSGSRPSGPDPEEGDSPRPSQAEGDLEEIEENLRQKEQRGQ
jgi:hypothetical protein